jgi:hypothetical protein
LCGICGYTKKENRDKRLNGWLCGESGNLPVVNQVNECIAKFAPEALQGKLAGQHLDQDITLVTACDPLYVQQLAHTFPNWRKYKKIDRWPVIVFVNGMGLDDKRLDFLRLPNVTLISWESGVDGAPKTDDHRELMLSAFVFGSAKHVKTRYWLKIDADSLATNDSQLVDDSMTKYAFIGHRWGYSWEKHIRALDAWAESHGDPRLKGRNGPMYPRGAVSGRRFYHNTKRTISFVQVNSTEFTKLCVRLAGNRLPAPSQDTFMFYVADRLGFPIGTDNFKKHRGMDQCKGLDNVLSKLAEVELRNNLPLQTHEETQEIADE